MLFMGCEDAAPSSPPAFLFLAMSMVCISRSWVVVGEGEGVFFFTESMIFLSLLAA